MFAVDHLLQNGEKFLPAFGQQGQVVAAVLLTRVETAEQFVQFGGGFGKQLRRKHDDVTLVVVGVESVDFMCVRIVEQKHVVTLTS